MLDTYIMNVQMSYCDVQQLNDIMRYFFYISSDIIYIRLMNFSYIFRYENKMMETNRKEKLNPMIFFIGRN